MGIALFGSPVHLRTARISQSYCPRHLVEGLPCRIVSGTAYDFKLAVILHDDQMGVAARYNQAYEGRFQIGMLDKIG